MSLPVPLSVRLATPDIDRHVTADLRDLSYRATAPGGFASARLSFHRPLSLPAGEVAQFSRIIVYNNAAEVMWEGRLEDPGRGAGSDGEIYDITAIGPRGHTRDRTVPLVYVDKDLSSLRRTDNVTPGGTAQVSEDPITAGQKSLMMQFPQGLTVGTPDRVVMRYGRIWQAGQKLARVSYTRVEGVTDASEQTRAIARTDGSLASGAQFSSVNFSTSPGTVTGVVVTDWSDGRNTLDLQIFRSAGAGAIPGGTFWTSIANLVVVAMRYNADGTEKTTGYTVNTVLASEVVADLLGRLLTKYDGANATIATTTHAIDQLAYPDGIVPEKVLDDLILLEAGHYWAVWESNVVLKHRFEFIPWPTTVRFEVNVADGFDSPASADELYDKVRVRYRDTNGEILTRQRSQTVQVLADAGITREAFIDLGDEMASQANADRAGDQFLADHATPPNRGTIDIARPIYDRSLGRMISPWELPRRAPGSLLRVRGVLPKVDSLNATGRDGLTVFRVIAAEFNAASVTARLELDSFQPTLARYVANLAKQPAARRR